MNRRELIQRVMVGSTVLLVVPSVLQSCSKDPSTDPGNNPPPGGDITIDLSLPANSALNTTGGSKVVSGVLVINLAAGFVALSSLCTHEGCTVGFDSASNNAICPCHGSKFNTAGGVVTGPAVSPLKKYNVVLENNILTIT
jgi:cytochrome b6-f complex iron-sulfur subunit